MGILGARLIAVEPYAPAQPAERGVVEMPEPVEVIARADVGLEPCTPVRCALAGFVLHL